MLVMRRPLVEIRATLPGCKAAITLSRALPGAADPISARNKTIRYLWILSDMPHSR